MKKPKMMLLWSGIVIELAGIVLIGRSIGSESSPALGIALLALGVVVIVIARATKPKANQAEPE